MAKGYPNLYKLGNTSVWSAMLTVPVDVRHVILDAKGKPIKSFTRSTGETDARKAYEIAAPWLREWRERIVAARQNEKDTGDAEVARLADEIRREHTDPMNEREMSLIYHTVRSMFARYGNVSPSAQRLAFKAGHARTVLSGGAGQQIVDRVMSVAPVKQTAFLAHLEAWQKATNLTGRGLDEATATLNEFANAHKDLSLESLTGGIVQQWVWGLLRREGKPLLPRSVSRKLAHLQNYWNHLQAAELVPADQKPFHGRKISDCRNGAEIAQAERLEFEADDVAKLLKAAKDDDSSLYAAILLAAYTGIRRESICTLKVSSVKTVEGIRCFDVAEKTVDGVRLVPVHSAIAGLVDSLIANPTPDGFLIHAGKFDQYGKRGGAIGKAFSDLKTNLGFGELHTFHSLRHTFQIAVEEAGASAKVRKNLMGHKVADLTEGRYGRKSPLATLAEAIEKISFPTV